MKKFLFILSLLYYSLTSSAQLNADFTWCPVYDTSAQLCCIHFINLSTDTGGIITGYHYQFGDGADGYSMDPLHCYTAIGTYIVYLYVADNLGNVDTAIHALTITHLDTTGCNCDSLIGVDDMEGAGFIMSVYPNPVQTTAMLTVSAQFPVVHGQQLTLRIYNAMGTRVHTEKVVAGGKQSHITIERRNLPGGLYYYELQSNKRGIAGSGKFLIQ
jgi:PKD repeat protein